VKESDKGLQKVDEEKNNMIYTAKLNFQIDTIFKTFCMVSKFIN